MTTSGQRNGLLLAATLGATVLAVRPPALGQAPPEGQASGEAPRQEVIITATRERDAVLTAKVEQAFQDDPYLWAGHIEIVSRNGIVRLQGIAYDMDEIRRALTLARRVAGRRLVVDEIELILPGDDGD
jgi:osmotically-inducible protein OsmY